VLDLNVGVLLTRQHQMTHAQCLPIKTRLEARRYFQHNTSFIQHHRIRR